MILSQRKNSPMEKLIIRKCNPEDIPAASAFYNHVVTWLDAHINYPKWIPGIYPSESTVTDRTQEGVQYLVFYNGILVAAFVLNTDPMGSYENGLWPKPIPEGSYMVLHTLAVDPSVQRNGIGSEIIRFCLQTAKSKGYQALRLDIVPTNEPAKKLYEKNGFHYAGDIDLHRRIEGIPVFSLYEKYC